MHVVYSEKYWMLEASNVLTCQRAFGTKSSVRLQQISDAAKRGIATHLMVYSTATGRVRNVELRPSSEWGGEGVVGCELATGLLHRIRRDSAS